MKLSDKYLRLIQLAIYRVGFGALVFLLGLFPCLIIAQEREPELHIQVISLRSGEPVLSKIVKIPPAEGEELRYTDNQGELFLPIATCSDGIRIEARPISSGYQYQSKSCTNGTSMLIRVKDISVVANLRDNFEEAITANDFATAAFVANELYGTRLRSGEEVFDEVLIYKYAALALGLEGVNGFVFDSMQGKNVMSPSLLDKVSDFQDERGITRTGQLNYRTFKELSGKTSAELQYSQYGRGQS